MRTYEVGNRRVICCVGAFALLCLLTAGMATATYAQPAETLTYYDNGMFKTESLSELKAVEEEAKQGGHMPWRQDAAFLAKVMTGNLLPSIAPGEEAQFETFEANAKPAVAIVTPSWCAEYVVAEETADRAVVDLHANGEASYRLTLVRPFGCWWYVTNVECRSAPARPVPQAKKNQWVEVRQALERRGFTVEWRADDRIVSATSKRIRATVQVGSNKATIDGRVITLKAPVRVANGRVYAPNSLISEIVTSDMVRMGQAVRQRA